MILSASGWRKVFAASGAEQDKTLEITKESTAISVAAAVCFFDYLSNLTGLSSPVIAVGMDTRPTGPAIADAVLHALVKKGAIIQFLGVSSAPEIMAYAKKLDGFIYISASHNPIGHNGIKFGTNDGGVLNAQENAKVTEQFTKLVADDEKLAKTVEEAYSCSSTQLKQVYTEKNSAKHNSLKAYYNFVKHTISSSAEKEAQDKFFDLIKASAKEKAVGVVCDFNGSSRNLCIDRDFFAENNIHFNSINDTESVHEIIPEAENLVHVAKQMEWLQSQGYKEYILGYMPDCDGDRGNIVYWDEKQKKAVILKAQEVFSLSVLAELCWCIWNDKEGKAKPAVAVNCPTSMRIEEIADKLGAKVFRAEVGEANVVNLAREKRDEGYTVPILGEGSNGGTITYPSSVRDPLNTVFALLKLLTIREDGLFELWCKKSGNKFKPDYTLTDILETLPKYTTTGVSEPRAVLKVKSLDHAKLKTNFQGAFEKSWKSKKAELEKSYGITSYEAIITNGTKETRNVKEYSLSKKGGLKILFKDKSDSPCAFIWMRGSGTEPVFRIMCDVKGSDNKAIKEEKALLEWETKLIKEADK